jgi:hypothetical protein
MIRVPFIVTIEVPNVGDSGWGEKVNAALFELQDSLNALRPGENGGVAILTDGGVVLDGAGNPITGGGTGGTAPSAVIDDSAASLTRTFSSVRITALVGTNLDQARAYTDQRISTSVLPANLVVMLDQNADGTWPPRGAQATTTKVIWRGLTVPPKTTGYALPKDSAILVKPVA